MANTFLADLINPQVIADFVETKLIDRIVFAPLAVQDNTLVGRAGDTLTFPKWGYIGDAAVVNEGASIGATKLTQSSANVQVQKIAKGVGYTDEAALSGLDGARLAQEATEQIVTAIAAKVDSQLLTEMGNATLAYTYDPNENGATNVAKALAQFGEDMEGKKVLVIPATKYADIIKEIVPNTDNGSNILHSGNVGMILGCEVVVTNRLSTEAYIVKPGALRLVNKRGVMIEYDRDPDTQQSYIYGSKLYAPYLYDASKIIKITL